MILAPQPLRFLARERSPIEVHRTGLAVHDQARLNVGQTIAIHIVRRERDSALGPGGTCIHLS
jgi:hypothetical protein